MISDFRLEKLTRSLALFATSSFLSSFKAMSKPNPLRKTRCYTSTLQSYCPFKGFSLEDSPVVAEVEGEAGAADAEEACEVDAAVVEGDSEAAEEVNVKPMISRCAWC